VTDATPSLLTLRPVALEADPAKPELEEKEPEKTKLETVKEADSQTDGGGGDKNNGNNAIGCSAIAHAALLILNLVPAFCL
jgi:hypothetical protein